MSNSTPDGSGCFLTLIAIAIAVLLFLILMGADSLAQHMAFTLYVEPLPCYSRSQVTDAERMNRLTVNMQANRKHWYSYLIALNDAWDYLPPLAIKPLCK